MAIPGAIPQTGVMATESTSATTAAEAAASAPVTSSLIKLSKLAQPTAVSVVGTSVSGVSQLSNNMMAATAGMNVDGIEFFSSGLSHLNDTGNKAAGAADSIKWIGSAAKDGSFSFSDLTKIPKSLSENLKDGLVGGVASLKNSFNTLPTFMQKSLMGDSGLMGSVAKNMMPGYSVTSKYAGFFNKITSGDYLLNPKSFKRDVGNLTAFTKSAMKNGLYDGIVTMGLRLGSGQNAFTQIATRTAMGLLVTKNRKSLLKMGVRLSSNSSLLSLSGGKTALVKTLFSGMSLPKIKSSDYRSFFVEAKGASRALDRTSIGEGTIPVAEAFSGASKDVRKVFRNIASDRNVQRNGSALNTVAPPDSDTLISIAVSGTQA